MPALTDVLLETTLPGHTRRRVWAHPELRSHSLLVLTFEHLHAAPLAGAPTAEAIATAEFADLDALLGPHTAVELTAIQRLKLDLLTNSIIADYKTRDGSTERLTITFATAEVADAFYTKLWRRLGMDNYRLLPYQREAWSAARAPLLLLIGALVATAVLALALSVFEDMASERAAMFAYSTAEPGAEAIGPPPPTLLERLLGWMNWRGVCAVGGVVAALAQLWLYRRLTSPPVSLELVKT